MNPTECGRDAVLRYAERYLSTAPEFLFARYPSFAVLRHESNGKWYAVLMTLPKRTLGLQGQGDVDVINMKCSPIMIGSLLTQPGYLPGYHMNKQHWITVMLDGTVAMDEVRFLLEQSYDLTKSRQVKRLDKNDVTMVK